MVEVSTTRGWVKFRSMGDAVRWLDADERRIWLGWVFTSRLLWEEIERDLQRDSGLSFGHYEILVMLSETPGRSRRMSELADATQSSRSRLSHTVVRLEELGWVRREACEEDRPRSPSGAHRRRIRRAGGRRADARRERPPPLLRLALPRPARTAARRPVGTVGSPAAHRDRARRLASKLLEEARAQLDG